MTPTDNLEAGAGDLVERLKAAAQVYEMATFHAADAESIEIDAGTAVLLRQAASVITTLVAETEHLDGSLRLLSEMHGAEQAERLAAERQLAAARADALEEAARVAYEHAMAKWGDDYDRNKALSTTARSIASSIRALIPGVSDAE